MNTQQRIDVVIAERTLLPHYSKCSKNMREDLFGYNTNALDWVLRGDVWNRNMRRYYFRKLIENRLYI